jgi:hypothetical protein
MLRRAAALAALTLGCFAATSALARAQIGSSLTRAGSGARAAGMADAFIGVSDDGTAATWNPAGLGQLRQPEFSIVYGVFSQGVRQTGVRSADDRLTYTSPPTLFTHSSIDFASAALPFSFRRRPVTIQVGWHRLYALDGEQRGDVTRFPQGERAVPEALISRHFRQDGSIDVVSLAGAVKLNSHLALGGSFDLWRGDWDDSSSLVEDPGPEGRAEFLTIRTDHRMRGHTVTAGLFLTYPSWNVGLVHHAPFWSSYRVTGDLRSTRTEPQRFGIPSARFRVPRSIGLGLARRLPRRWMVAASVTHDQWTKAVVTGVPGQAGEVNFFDELPVGQSTVRDTVSISVGVERLYVIAGAVVPLRLGFGWEPQGAMDPVTRDPVDYHLASAGVGYNTNRIKVDAAVQFRWGAFTGSDVYSVDTALRGGYERDAFGRAAAHEWRIKMSAIYRIADTDRLKELLRKIFG